MKNVPFKVGFSKNFYQQSAPKEVYPDQTFAPKVIFQEQKEFCSGQTGFGDWVCSGQVDNLFCRLTFFMLKFTEKILLIKVNRNLFKFSIHSLCSSNMSSSYTKSFPQGQDQFQYCQAQSQLQVELSLKTELALFSFNTPTRPGKFIFQHFSVNVDQVPLQEYSQTNLEDDLNSLSNGR